MVTFRSDHLNRTHPIRPLVAGLARMDGVIRLELPRLSHDQVAAQIKGILGHRSPPSVTNAVYERGGGNPLFTEALLNPDGTVSADLPWSLRELLLSAVKDLPEQTQQLLRTAAVGGSQVGHALLAAVTGSDDAALTTGLRPAVAANVLVAVTDGYAGHWDEAVEILDEVLSQDLPPLGRFAPLKVRGQIAVARGERETAVHTLAELRSAESQRALALAELQIECQLADGDLTSALATGAMVPTCDLDADPRYSWPLLAAAMRACADASTADPARRAGELTHLREALTACAARIVRRSPVQRAHAATFAAEASPRRGGQDLAGWDAAAAAWEATGQPYPLAYALLRSAGAASADGNREAAVIRLRRTARIADRLAAEPLRQQISQLARRARILLASPGNGDVAGPAVPFGLTVRELEVLRLAAAGRSNREIAAELFISPRTASVHVSNILAKLNVASRGEAAATAHRLHLSDTP